MFVEGRGFNIVIDKYFSEEYIVGKGGHNPPPPSLDPPPLSKNPRYPHLS